MHDIVHHRSFLAEIRGLIKLIRPKQWVKNSFVFAPLIFAGEFLKIGSVYSALFAAFLFCLAASAVYIVNDLKDIEKDYAAMNAVWDAWISEGNPPARTCVESKLYAPDVLVEMTVVAVLP